MRSALLGKLLDELLGASLGAALGTALGVPDGASLGTLHWSLSTLDGGAGKTTSSSHRIELDWK